MVHEGGSPQPPQYGGPQYGGPQPRKSRGPLVLVAVLGLVLVVVVAVGVVVLVRHDSSKPVTAPRTPEAVEFRRVVKSGPGTCDAASPAPQVACDGDGNRYTLGKVEVDGTHVRTVKAEAGQTGSWFLLLTFDDEGKKVFAGLTAELAQLAPPDNQIAIVVRGSVVTAPTVQSAITDGQVQITGTFSKEDAEKLADQITG